MNHSCMTEAWAETLRNIGLMTATAKSYEKENDHDLTGVWIDDRKILSIGIGIKNWCSLHGSALNLTDDPRAFTGISTCGFSSNVMTSVARELQLINTNVATPSPTSLAKEFTDNFLKLWLPLENHFKF